MPSTTTVLITGLTVRTVRVPLQTPHRTASGIITESPLILTDLHTDCGTQGHSMIFTYTPAALTPTAALLRNLEELIRGEALAPAAVTLQLANRFRLLGTQGLVGMALAALDMAMWDALARVQAVSLVHLLGGRVRSVRAYAPIGYDGEAGCAEAAETWARQGFTGIKAKIGYPTVAEDLAVVQAMRRAAGDQMAIMVDYNQSLTPTEATMRLRVLAANDLLWVEEPTLAQDFTGMARVASATHTPIQCGENWWGTTEMRHAIDAGATDFVMPDVMKIGGVTGWLQAAALAQVHNLPMSNHLWPELSARLLCCTPTAHWLEYADWWNPILKSPLVIEDGMALLPDTIGSGIEWNAAAVDRYGV